MIAEGQVVLFRFPQADQTPGKLRPALVLRQAPAPYDDWLVCMISTQLSQAVTGFDEVVEKDDSDFSLSALKMPSIIRISRLAVVERAVLLGRIGSIDPGRLSRIRARLARWIEGT